MRKFLAAAALAGSMAATGLAIAPAASAATAPATTQATASASFANWGKYYSSNKKAYTYGKTWKFHGKVYTKWYGKEFTSKRGYVWFQYVYKHGKGLKSGKHFYGWNGAKTGTWSKKGIVRLYTYTCWGGPTKYCGAKHKIYG